MTARYNALDDVDFAKQVAEVYLTGASAKEMAKQLDCGASTIPLWIKDPRVSAHIRRGARERVNRISRKIDGEIEGRLMHVSDWELDQLLKVRKEYLDRPLKLEEDGGASEAGATNEVADLMDADPETAAQLLAILQGAANKKKAPKELSSAEIQAELEAADNPESR